MGELRIFKDSVAIVTGGASGIGRAICSSLAKKGAYVVLADLNGDGARAAAEEIKKGGGDCEAATLDVADPEAVKTLVERVASERGRLDFMFNNAGIGVCGKLEDYEYRHWRRVIDVDLMGAVNGIHSAYPLMARQGFGHIVNTSSMAGLTPIPLVYSYTASKFAIVGLSLTARMEAASRGVRVSVICPGVVRTPMLRSSGEGNEVLFDAPEEEREKAFAPLFPMAPEKFAEKVLKKVARNRAIIIEPAWWVFSWWLFRLAPMFVVWINQEYFYKMGLRKMAEAEKKAKLQRK